MLLSMKSQTMLEVLFFFWLSSVQSIVSCSLDIQTMNLKNLLSIGEVHCEQPHGLVHITLASEGARYSRKKSYVLGHFKTMEGNPTLTPLH